MRTKTMKPHLTLLVALLLAPLAALHAAETSSERDARMAWWREARFGMFIHWGAYAQMGGVWDGQRIDAGVGHGIGEWIMYNAKIPVADYAREATKFNPAEFDADAWVRLAKEAGQRYIVVTTKHHDGFALFDSQASPFNIADHTPFKRDVMKELAAACRKHGVRLGFYYSQAQDWHHPGGAAYKNTFNGGDPAAGRWDTAQEGSFDDYLDRIAIPQARELLTNYGPVAVFWWDTPVGMNRARAEKLAALLALQPGIITNNRLNNRDEGVFLGDTETPEQTIPPTGFKDRDFEVCMTNEIVATLASAKPGAKLRLQIGKESATATLQDVSSPAVLGRLTVPAAGVQELTLRPVAVGWQPLVLRSITLRPAPPSQP
jgi:alpha-L-fucosidase